MRFLPRVGFVWIALAAIGACSKAPSGAPENTSSSTLPPITICYLPDGAYCPAPDAGDDAGDGDGGASEASPSVDACPAGQEC